MNLNRKPTLQELKLLELLVNKASIPFPDNWKKGLLVSSMDDGRMGSLNLLPNGEINIDRKFGKRVSELQFSDKDGLEVIASLNLDDKGKLFEMDVWKTDYSKLIRIPNL